MSTEIAEQLFSWPAMPAGVVAPPIEETVLVAQGSDEIEADKAMTALYMQVAPGVYKSLLVTTHDAHEAADVTQDTFERVVKHITSYTTGNFEGWVHTIKKHALNRSRRPRHAVLPEFVPLVGDNAEADPDQTTYGTSMALGDTTAEQAIARVDGNSFMRSLLGILSQGGRDVIWKTVIEDKPYKQAAAELGISLTLLQSRRAKALQKLRAVLGAKIDPEFDTGTEDS